ncbi:MAG: sulfite exporter TauE/SafE family protein [Acidobacteria bacterium]|nr:sulfite exporter TauE/SafE family protein [Acidobacteriota bacterium]
MLRAVHELLVFGAAIVAGAINSVAGGGTLVSFPTLIWLGIPSITANATNTVALWPGSLGSAWGYRREMRGIDSRAYALVVPSLVGGIAGAVLLYSTPTEVFDRLVPLLILFATLLFMAQEPIQRRFNMAPYRDARSHWLSWTMLFQLGVALYGGYFGAGIGILMLAALSLMGHTDIHQMNGLKNVLAVCINGIAAVYFMFTGLVFWPDALIMAAGAVIGGIGGARVARRVGRTAVRRIVVGIGFAMTLSLMLRL